jgi:salicylate hydroxylase
VALAGDAAHPMRPYLAQGAAMAIEDAWTLGELMARPQPTPGERDWAALFQRFAQVRWKRNARVQAGAVRNGQVFHAQGALRTARNLAMGLGGERLLDNAWLYSGPPRP